MDEITVGNDEIEENSLYGKNFELVFEGIHISKYSFSLNLAKSGCC
jgi:hypothetical protein